MKQEQIICSNAIIHYINVISGNKNSWQKIKKEIEGSTSPLLIVRIFEIGFLLSFENDPEKYSKHLGKLYKYFGDALVVSIRENLPPLSEQKFVVCDKKKSKRILIILAHQLAKGDITFNKLEPVVKKLCECFDFKYTDMYVYNVIQGEYNFEIENLTYNNKVKNDTS